MSGFSTDAVHAGQRPDPATGALSVPVYQTSTYAQEAPNKHKGFDYSRTSNPTRSALEACIATLENARHGLAFSSGMAATNTVMNLLKKGDHVVAASDLYGGTYRLFTSLYGKYGIEFDFVDATDAENIAAKMRENTRLIWVESPSNPLLKLTDIQKAAKVKKNALLVVDSTLSTPFLQQPLGLGADLVVHSTTKYLGGHGDLIGGAIALDDEALYKKLKFYQNSVGAVPGPFDCWLTLRGIKTLPLRMKKHCDNALEVASFLEAHPKVKKVVYPGIASHPQHSLAKSQMKGFGGMIAFELEAGFGEAMKLVSSTRLVTLAEDLGGVKSLLCHPASMTHKDVPREDRLKAGLTDETIRLSIGIEDAEDIIADLDEALGTA